MSDDTCVEGGIAPSHCIPDVVCRVVEQPESKSANSTPRYILTVRRVIWSPPPRIIRSVAADRGATAMERWRNLGLKHYIQVMNDVPSDPLGSATAWMDANRKVALATVTRTWGSAPRPAGSQMAVRDDGAFSGSVSGGCVEGSVIAEAEAALGDGKSRNLKFGVSNEDAWAVGLACGGTIEIHVAPVLSGSHQAVIGALKKARDE